MRIGGINPMMSQLSQLGQLGQAGQAGQAGQTSGVGITDQTLSKGTNSGSIGQDSGEDFGSMLKEALSEVNGMQGQSSQLQNDYLQGKPVEFHDLMITMEKASTAMALTLQVRNKLLEAYQEIARTQV